MYNNANNISIRKSKGSRRSEKRKREEEEEKLLPYEATARKPAWEREQEREKETYSLPIKQDGRILQGRYTM